MLSISIKKVFADDHITRIAGERLKDMILEGSGHGEPVEIDFTGTVIASTSFFDEGFAKLAESGWTRERFNSQVLLKNIGKKDREILLEMCSNRGMK